MIISVPAVETEASAPAVYNVALGKTVTSDSGSTSTLSAATDGSKDTYSYANENSGGTGHYFQIDLGDSFKIDTIVLWRYFADQRTYEDVIVQISNSSTFASGVTTVYNNDTDNSAGFGIGSSLIYRERSSGKTMSFFPTEARYVRVYSNGSNINDYNHIVEIEVWTTSATENNLASKKPYTKSVSPHIAYPDSGNSESTDGILAKDLANAHGYTVGSSLTVDLVVDLGTRLKIETARYHPYEGYFYQPGTITVYTSNDGVNFTSRGTLPELEGAEIWRELALPDVSARFVKFSFSKTYAVFGDEWMFLDEIQVLGPDLSSSTNVALGTAYASTADAGHADTGYAELTDGVYATGNFADSAWHGRQYQPVYHQTVDLGSVSEIDGMFGNFLQETGFNIYWPDAVSFAVSSDGINFTSLGTATPGSAYGYNNTYKKYTYTPGSPVSARYVRMTVENAQEWTFSDEMEVSGVSKASDGKSYTSSQVAAYTDTGGTELTDGVYATGAFDDAAWQGRQYPPGNVYTQTIDLGSNQSVKEMMTNFLQQTEFGIYWPSSVAYAYSTNGTDFTSAGSASAGSAYGPSNRYKTYTLDLGGSPVTARYIRMTVTAGGEWTFEDEMEVWTSSGNKATGQPYTSIVGASATYPDTGAAELTDGEYATGNYSDADWQGRRYQTGFYHTFDLGAIHDVNIMSGNFLQDVGNGIYWPDSVNVSYSTDGVTFTSAGNAAAGSAYGPGNSYKKYTLNLGGSPVTAKYVRMKVNYSNEWLFMDEVEIWSVPADPADPGAAPSSEDILNLIPYPQSVSLDTGNLTLTGGSRIVYNDNDLAPLAAVLQDEIHAITGLTLSTANDTPDPGDISLVLTGAGANDEYTLDVGTTAVVTSYSYKTVAMGTATLLQLLQANGDIPKLEIDDSAELEYRSIMVDVARQKHTIDTLKQVVVLSRLYKISYVHLHLNDHNAWTFPSTAFPDLGSNNSGAHGGIAPDVYTIQELEDLVAFADERGVTIVPEINTPGHSGTMAVDEPATFAGYNSGSVMMTNGYVNMVGQDAYDGMETIFGEVAAIFQSSPYIVIGGDEASFPGIDQITTYSSFLSTHGIDEGVNELYAFWVDEMREYVEATGKTAISWEGYYGRGDAQEQIETSLIFINWHGQNYAADDMIEDGYTVINTPWSTFSHYEWSPFSFNSSEAANPETHNIEVDPADPVIGSIFPRWETQEEAAVPTLRTGAPDRTERTWNPDGTRGYYDFLLRFRHTNQLLDTLLDDL